MPPRWSVPGALDLHGQVEVAGGQAAGRGDAELGPVDAGRGARGEGPAGRLAPGDCEGDRPGGAAHRQGSGHDVALLAWGGDPPGTPRWLNAPLLRHRALALLAWGGDPPGTPRWLNAPFLRHRALAPGLDPVRPEDHDRVPGRVKE